MNYPCEIIRDLLPLYIDNICNEKSRQAIDQHLVDCEACQNYCNAMKSSEGFVGNEYCSEDDKKMVNSLKNIKPQNNCRNHRHYFWKPSAFFALILNAAVTVKGCMYFF